jgi:recombination protein RecA
MVRSALQAPPQTLQAPQALSREARVEALLRERKLDRAFTTAIPVRTTDQVAAFGVIPLDERLHGGVPRGQVSELIGPTSSGRTSLAWTWLGAATRRGESVALIDTFDRFDPATAEACGIELSRLLWIRGQAITKTAGAVDPAWLPGARAVEGPGTLLERTIDRSLKALNLVLQSGVCTAVVLDFADVPVTGIRRVPHTTWLRLQRVVEGTDTACLLLGPLPLARSAAGITITTGATGATGAMGATGATRAAGARGATGAEDAPDVFRRPAGSPDVSRRSSERAKAEWAGEHDRSRRLAGLRVTMRVSSPRRTVEGTAALDTVMRNDAWAIE